MKKLATILLFVSFLISETAIAGDKVLATYTGGEVTEKQVMKQFKSVLSMQPESREKKFSELDENTQEMLVRGFINSKLLEKEGKKLKIRKSKEFKEKVKDFEMQLVQQEVLERELKNKITDKMIDNEYKELVKNLKNQKEVKTSHILVDTEEKAKEIKKKLNKGADFAKLAKEFSKDESSKINSGEIGYTPKGQLVPEYEEIAFSMKKNEISNPVKSQFGWHVIKMLDERPVEIPTKEQAKQSIRGKLSRDVIEKYFKNLANKAKIELKIKH